MIFEKATNKRVGFLSFLLFLTLARGANGQSSDSLGRAVGVFKLPDGVEIQSERAKVRVTAVTDSVIRIRVTPGGEFAKDTSWSVSPRVSPKPSVTVNETSSLVEVGIAAGRLRVEKESLRMVFLDSNGEVINEDDTQAPIAFNRTAFRVTKKMPADETYYGLGDKTSLNLRDHAFTMWNTDAFGWQESTDPLYKSIPFFTALRNGKAYGIFLDNTWRTYFDFGKASRDSYSFGADGGQLNYYFLFGPDPKKVLMSYADLTGKPPLPPLWSLGYQQCRYSYYPESRVRELAQTFRKERIPADVIYLDIDYQDAYRPFTINRQYFPSFEALIPDLRKMGFSVIAITDLHIAKVPGYKPFDTGLAADYFVKNADGTLYVGKVWPGDSVFPEFTLSSVRRWWGTLYKDFVDMGIRGFWNDMNEPAIFNPDKTMPLSVEHRLDDGTTLDHRAVHNVFGMQNSRATYEGLVQLEGNERPFVLTRASYAGGQRYAASWTGDNSATWNHMRLTIPTLLNLSISGYPLVGVDIGGFAGNPSPDLLTRWMALGAFNPIYRNHAQKGSANREPWVDGPEHEVVRKKFIEQRYRMLPYIYSLAEEMARTGLPIMRPLFMEFPADQSLNANQDEFLLGPHLLVAPNLSDSGGAYDVKLPSGEWYDYWTGQRLAGGLGRKQPVSVTPKLDELPVYVRAGAILPHQPVVQSTQEVPQGPLELRVYPGTDCYGSLYLDDGHTFNYQKGEFLRLGFTCLQAAHSLSVQISSAQGNYEPWFHELLFTVHGISSAPMGVAINGRPIQTFRYDNARGVVAIPSAYSRSGMTLEIKY